MQLDTQNSLMVHHIDVTNAYLNAVLIDYDLSAEQSQGFAINGHNSEKLVCKLERSSYILKSSGLN